jgi:hypothetical protein
LESPTSGYRFRTAETLLNQEISLSHHPTFASREPEEKAEPPSALQKEDLLLKVYGKRHEIKGA